MTESKLKAYKLGIITGTFKGNSQKVYNLLKQKDMTTEAIYVALNSQRNELSGRISDLLDAGLIKEKKSGRYTLLTISGPHEISMLSNTRKSKKVEKWVKAGEKLGIKFNYTFL